VETFNSFCEKFLKTQNNMKVINYRQKKEIINKAVSALGLSIGDALDLYFTPQQKKGKTNEELANIFLNDCFFIRDYSKFKGVEEFYTDDKAASLVFSICRYIDAFMKKHSLRDYADQLMDTINILKEKEELIPSFEHILIDEYQDVNTSQVELLNILSPDNIFCVGDPRQSIYGWRGSDINFILNFQEKGGQVIALRKNYRSTGKLVKLMNKAIKDMKMPDLESVKEGETDMRLLNFGSESAEFEFVIQGILSSKTPYEEIIVLARTNRQLKELSLKMKERGIKHVLRSDELRRSVEAGKDEVTLATIHAIKGLEAEKVFVIGCNSLNFPCKGSEHPVVDMVKVDEYDQEEEEKRLFYVAISRARKNLYLTYSGTRPTYFITDSMKDMLTTAEKPKNVVDKLKEWRKEMSRKYSVAPYLILSDKAIIDLSIKMPMERYDLKEIYGMGPSKISRFGDQILDVLHN
ncbi:MAG: 3'-5' exonuclease, partial [Nanobdellota archaeon]